MAHSGNAPSLTKNKNFRKVVIVLIVILLILIFASQYKEEKAQRTKIAQSVITHQIYANYQFPKDAVQIDIQLIPENQLLSREAGGWIITPAGSDFRIDYNVPIAIEYIDGRKFYRQPGEPAHDGVRPSNSIFRLYKVGGESGIAKVTIKRNVF